MDLPSLLMAIFIHAGNEDMHKISHKFEFWPDQTTDYGFSCLEHLKTFSVDL